MPAAKPLPHRIGAVMAYLWVKTLGTVPKGPERLKYEQARPEGGWSPIWFPVWSFDNPSIHGGSRPGTREPFLRALGLPDAEVFPLPVHSSDIHKPVEHTHARVVTSFESEYYDDPQPHTLATYKDRFKGKFESDPSVARAEVIAADVHSRPWQKLPTRRGEKLLSASARCAPPIHSHVSRCYL